MAMAPPASPGADVGGPAPRLQGTGGGAGATSIGARGPCPALCGLRVGVATVRGRPYYRFASALRRIGVRFDSMLPGEAASYAGDAVLTTRAEAPASSEARAALLFEDACGLEPAVLAGRLLRCRPSAVPGGGGEHLLAGIDPGSRIGLSVSYRGCEIESSLHASPARVAARVAAIFAGLEAARRTVRIGNGSRGTASRIAELLGRGCAAPFEIEIVDECGTSPRSKSCNQGGRRDRISALRISRRPGVAVARAAAPAA